MDMLDILQGRFEKTMPGVYFEKKPERIGIIRTIDDIYKIDSGIPFDYEYISPNESRYKSLLGNIMQDGSNPVISTFDDAGYKVKGFVLLSNCKMYTIASKTEDVNKSTAEARRYFSVPMGTEYILELAEYDDGGVHQ